MLSQHRLPVYLTGCETVDLIAWSHKTGLFFTQLRKKICQKSSRVSFPNSGVNLWSVMTLGMLKDAGPLLYASGFWI